MAKFIFFGTTYYLCKNSATGKYYLRRSNKPYVDKPTTAQLASRYAFKVRVTHVNDWLRANRPSEQFPDGTSDYQYAQQLKRHLHLASVTQVIYKFINSKGKVILPQ